MRIRLGASRASLYCLAFLLAHAICAMPSVLAGEPQWVEVRSPNFSVLTDAGERSGRDVALRFEQMRAVFGALLTKAKVNLPVPLQIVAFRNTREIRQVAPIWKGKPTQVAGLFQGGADRSFIMLDMSASDPWTVVFHEYAHQLLNGNMEGEADAWFEEGFAEYFSSIEVDGKEARVGKIPTDTYLILQQVGTMKVADLLKVRQYSETYNQDGNRRTSFYAESAMLVHYIYDNHLLPKVGVYLDLKFNKKASMEDAVQQAFGMSIPQLDKALQNYILSGHFRYYPMPAPANISEKTYTSRPVTGPNAAATIADIHLHSLDHREKAVAEFQDVLKSDPTNAAACRGLGYAYLQRQDFTQAAEYFKRASQTDSADPRVHYYSALLMAREGGFAQPADLPEFTKELEAAISLDPNFADSYALLAFAQTSSGDPAKALESMRKALAIDPRNENYRFNLASIYLANRQPDQAIAVLESLKNSASVEVASRAETALVNANRFQRPPENPSQEKPSEVFLKHRDGSNALTSANSPAATPSEPASTAVKWGAPVFVRGTVKAIDCTSAPSALLTISSKAITIKVKIVDKDHVIVIGADQFSCLWENRRVAVNYRQSDSGDTSVMSLELQ